MDATRPIRISTMPCSWWATGLRTTPTTGLSATHGPQPGAMLATSRFSALIMVKDREELSFLLILFVSFYPTFYLVICDLLMLIF